MARGALLSLSLNRRHVQLSAALSLYSTRNEGEQVWQQKKKGGAEYFLQPRVQRGD